VSGATVSGRLSTKLESVPSVLPKKFAAIAGLLAAAVGLGTGELVAGLADAGAPIRKVGDRVVDGAPKWLKDFGIRNFGTNDKAVLLGTVLAVLAIGALLVGRLAAKRFIAATAAIASVTVIGLVFALTGRKRAGIDSLPIVVAGIVTVAALWLLVKRGYPKAAEQRVSSSTESADPQLMAESMTGPAVVNRRRFLSLGGATAGAAAITTVIGRQLQGDPVAVAQQAAVTLPKANETLAKVSSGVSVDVPGMTPWLTPVADFYRIDTALTIPRVRADTWKLTIGGRVKKPLTLTYADLQKRPLVEHDCTLMCVSNEIGGGLVGNARWTGVRLADVLNEAGVEETGADQIFVTSVDGFTAGFPTKLALDGREALIAIAMNGKPLTFKHGFPARLVIPGIYGYVSAVKWLDSIELTTFEEKQGYWIPRGWSALGPVKVSSRIDVAGPTTGAVAGPTAIAGVAWAQHVGITKVEVQVDDEPWQTAELAADGGIDTWRQWKVVWNATKGTHKVRVRATNAEGETQPEERTPVAPNGATGWHTISVDVK
jgi:DMSO/TMAO reductase YedYZ molybdopterin-dependent catalytic subunit